MRELNTYIKRGSKAVILFHAFSSGPIDMNALGKALAREDYTVLMPTLAGHGTKNPDNVLQYNVEDWKKNGDDAYQKLIDDGYTDISVFGLSLGGIIATHVMMNHDVKSFGVFSAPVMTTEDSNVPESFRMMYQSLMKRSGISGTEAEKKEKEAMEKLKTIFSGLRDYTDVLKNNYKNIDVPVFIGQGAEDELIRATQAGAFRDELINAPAVDFNCYETGPHVITTGRTGKELQKDLIEFLKKHA